MQYTRGNQTRAALMMGINRGTLRKKTEKIRHELILVSCLLDIKGALRHGEAPFYYLRQQNSLLIHQP